MPQSRPSAAIARRQFLILCGALPAGELGGFALGPQQSAANWPKQILIIRHAEKNDSKADIHLNTRGYQRAAALPTLFPLRFETPDFLFASRQSKHSNRPVETVTPLASALGLKIDNNYAEEDFRFLSQRLLSKPIYAGKIVLICWHHENIPGLARALGVKDAPARWPEKRFDQIWRIEYPEGIPSLTVLPQNLLPGDS
jgi:hypothetical protein